jgi:purine-binding chemotaxis protein CheW
MLENETKVTGGKEVVLPKFGLAEDILGKPQEPAPAQSGSKARKESAKEDRGAQYVTFFLEKEEYALPIGQVQEINRVGEITRVPNAPDHVMGVINLRGKIVPVIELKKRLKLGKTEITRESRVVVVEAGPKILGLMVDRVAQVLHLTEDMIEQTPEEIAGPKENYVKSVGKIDGRMVILLDLPKIVRREAAA